LARNTHTSIGTRGQSLEKVTDEEWHELIDGILSTVFYMSKPVARHMIARGQGGVIINVSSINAYIIPSLTPRHNVPYCVAKEKTLMRSHGRKVVRT
jgi:NAD(P)-dependent dehydrogenase (short-subunit alcohol dehydrogenase family)